METILRYCSGSGAGLAGKIAQLSGSSVALSPDTTVVPPIVQRLDGFDESPRFSGTIAHIYVGVYEGKAVCLKIVHDDTIKIVQVDAKALRKAGGVASLINDTMTGVANVLADTLVRECDMEHERTVATTVRNALYLRPDIYDTLRVSVPIEVARLCSSTCFAYEFLDGEPLSPPVDTQVAKRIVVLFFTLLHKDGILLGDPHRENFLQQPDGTLALLDFGCVHKLRRGARFRCAQMHLARGDRDLLAASMPEATDGVLRAVTKISQALWNDTDLPPTAELNADMQTVDLMGMEVDKQMVLVTRAMAMLSTTAEALGVRRVGASEELAKIDKFIT
jgi:predicted unusual protein kinase regulating ubiquinone biosynthesis (AarF/ABC1/UbiB family)